jgi:phosphate transport system substrate-binding protein
VRRSDGKINAFEEHGPSFGLGSLMRARIFTTVVSVCLAVTALCLAGCTLSVGDPAPEKDLTRLRVSGSGTCLPLLRILTSEQPDRAVRMVFLPGLHTKGGVRGVIQGSLDIGAVSRDLNPDEQSSDLKVTWLSQDGLVVAVNPSVGKLGITDITDQQIRDIYAGKYTDWQQLGASQSMPIVVLDRHEDESAKIIMRKFIFGSADQLKVTPDSVNLYYESDMVDALQSTVGSVGYFSLGYAISQNIAVTRLRLNGVEATVANIESGAYKLVRPLGIVTRTAASAQVRAFAEWVTGPDARRIMLSKGYAPYDE